MGLLDTIDKTPGGHLGLISAGAAMMRNRDRGLAESLGYGIPAGIAGLQIGQAQAKQQQEETRKKQLIQQMLAGGQFTPQQAAMAEMAAQKGDMGTLYNMSKPQELSDFERWRQDPQGFRDYKQAGATPGDAPSAVREYNFWKDLPADQRQDFERLKRDPGIQMIAGVPYLKTPQGLQPLIPENVVRGMQGRDTYTQRAGTLSADSDMRPGIEADITTAKGTAQSDINRKEEARSNDKALRVFNTGMSGLESAMAGTTTGPMVGWLPAVTEGAQTAEGSLSLMAPILKDVFRQAGEGTFTKDDQEILMNMLPKRTDTPGTQRAKIAAVKRIVAEKLGNVEEAPKTPSKRVKFEDLK